MNSIGIKESQSDSDSWSEPKTIQDQSGYKRKVCDFDIDTKKDTKYEESKLTFKIKFKIMK